MRKYAIDQFIIALQKLIEKYAGQMTWEDMASVLEEAAELVEAGAFESPKPTQQRDNVVSLDGRKP